VNLTRLISSADLDKEPYRSGELNFIFKLCQYIEVRSIAYGPSLLSLIFLPFVFIFGFYFDMLGLKLVAFAAVSLATYLILITPYKWALFFLFIYIGLEGFFKVVSNYHPVIHVGSDILVLTLTLKVVIMLFFKGLPQEDLPPFTQLFLIHFLWLIIVLFNPYALSVVSSIAGAKIYISMFLLYFYGYYNVRTLSDVRFFMFPFIIVAVIHTLTGLVQGLVGPEALLALHPRYAVQLFKYKDFAFRPFGMTNLPGGPAVYVYQIIPFILYFLFHYKAYIGRFLLGAYLPLATFLFFLCQVRSALLKMLVGSALFFIGIIHAFSRTSYRTFNKVVIITSVVGLMIYLSLPRFMEYSVNLRPDNEEAIERSLSLFDYETVSTARRGTWSRFIHYVQEVPFGAGFARVGAAAGAFKELHKQDPIFGYKYFFTDNLWLTLLVELGVPGMLIVTLLFGSIMIRGYRNYLQSRNLELRVAMIAILAPLTALCLGFYGAEGLMYNPEACFFWFFAGVLMKLPQIKADS
jgi:hypothetical protein